MIFDNAGSAKLTVNRLVVLEWLSEDEPRTGKQMVEKLKAQDQQLPIEYFKCHSKKDIVEHVLTLANQAEQGFGAPILHIEAHGYSPTTAAENAIGLSCRDCEALLWDELAIPLRRLNIATKFNLVFVVAACWSDSAFYSVIPNNSLPFVLAIGFATTVRSDHLELAMTKLYQSLLMENHTLSESLNLAHSQLDNSSEALSWLSLPSLLKKTAQMSIEAIDDPGHMMDRYMSALSELEKAKASSISLFQFRIAHLSHAPSAIEKVIGTLLAYEYVPDNRSRFGFDGKAFLREYLSKNNNLSTSTGVPIFLFRSDDDKSPYIASMADVDIQFMINDQGGFCEVIARKGGEEWPANEACSLLKANWSLIYQAIIS